MQERERSAVARLVRLGGDELARHLIALYTNQMRERLAAARTAAELGDTDVLAALAHAMRSSSAQLGAEDLAAACESMEEAADRGDTRRAAVALVAVETHFDALVRWLATEVPSPESAEPFGGVRPRASVDSGHPLSRVAVIEDNADNRLLIDAILGDRFALDEYENGANALAGMQRRVPDLVLLDVSLPGMDGLDVLRRMRADEALRRVPVVAVTAHAMDGDRERYLAAGFDAYVPKPIVDDAALVAIVTDLLASAARGAD